MRLLRVGMVGLVALASACSDDAVEDGSGGAAGTGGAEAAPASTTSVTSGAGGSEGTGGSGDGGGAAADCSGTHPEDPTFAAAMDMFRATLDEGDIAGGALAVIQDGVVTGIGVAGSKLATSCDPITLDTLFQTGLVGSQLITTIAALDAVEDGALVLDAPITDVAIPTLEVDNDEHGDASAITLQHLLSNGSMYDTASETNNDAVCTTLEDFFAEAVDPVLQAAPGTMADHQDLLNFELAGLALENVDGEPFRDVARRRVLEPLGMGGSYDRVTIEQADHTKGDGGTVRIHAECGSREPSVGYHGSIRDVSRLYAYLAGGEGDALDAATRDEIRATQGVAFVSTCTMTYAFQSCTPAGEEDERVLLLGNSSWGFTYIAAIYEDRGLAIVALFNREGANLEPLLQSIAREYDPAAPAWWDNSYVQDADEVASLAGTYRDDLGFQGLEQRTLEVTSDPDAPAGLVGVLTADGSPPVEVAFAPDSGPDNFFLTIGSQSAYARFWRDEAGEAYAFSTNSRTGPPFFRVVE